MKENKKILETDRLLLRTWNDSDFYPMARMNQDRKVMEYFPSVIGADATKNFIAKVRRHFDEHGYSLYAVERKNTGKFIGFTGFLTVGFVASFTPAVEIGWRLASNHWGKGFTTESAKAVLDYGFRELGSITNIVSFTSKNNTRSIRVMQKIGLLYDVDGDFDHPNINDGSPLKRHVLYRLSKSEYLHKCSRFTN